MLETIFQSSSDLTFDRETCLFGRRPAQWVMTSFDTILVVLQKWTNSRQFFSLPCFSNLLTKDFDLFRVKKSALNLRIEDIVCLSYLIKTKPLKKLPNIHANWNPLRSRGKNILCACQRIAYANIFWFISIVLELCKDSNSHRRELKLFHHLWVIFILCRTLLQNLFFHGISSSLLYRPSTNVT